MVWGARSNGLRDRRRRSRDSESRHRRARKQEIWGTSDDETERCGVSTGRMVESALRSGEIRQSVREERDRHREARIRAIWRASREGEWPPFGEWIDQRAEVGVEVGFLIIPDQIKKGALLRSVSN